MRLILLATLLALAFTSPLYFRGPTTPISDSEPTCISDYFTAFFAKFDLDQPNQIIKCFDDKSAALYFKHLYAVAELTKDAEARNKVQVHLDWAKLGALHKALKGTLGCVSATEDFSKLLKALGAEERNPHLFLLAKYIYYQANFGPLSKRFGCLTDALNEKNFTKAGHIAGCITNKTASEIKGTGLGLQALNGVWNGVHIGLGLPDAESVWGCWNNETAVYRLEFLYGMANAVANGSWKDAAVNTEKWYKEGGSDLVKKIPEDTWKCWGNSNDTKAESAKLKIDINSDEFYEKVNKFVHSHQAAYWKLQKAIKDSLDEHNFIHAGSAYGHLLQAAAATK